MQVSTAASRPAVRRALACRIVASLALGAGLLSCGRTDSDVPSAQREPEPLTVELLASPARPGSEGPWIHVSERGDVHLSWLEVRAGNRTALRFSTWRAGGDESDRAPGSWSEPRTAASGENWFVNWADVPSVVGLPESSFAAHWLVKSGAERYAYDVALALAPAGAEWSRPRSPHDDGTATEHGFVSLVPWGRDAVLAVWLDGRAYAPRVDDRGDTLAATDEMSLRAAIVDARGEVTDEAVLDSRVCDCCPTTAVRTRHGVLVAYRDRSPGEVRDIGLVRYRDGVWSEPRSLHADGWVTPGCPVNGPALAAEGSHVAIGWYTVEGESGAVKVAHSTDDGASFGPPVRVDGGDPLGRVDVCLLPDGDALVVWLEQGAEDDDASIWLRRVGREGPRAEAQRVVRTSPARASGIPRLARGHGGTFLAWTSPGDSSRVEVARLRP